WMSVIGNGVILLMQMTVFPYIVVSLIGGIGSLSRESAGMLFRKAGVIMLLLWLLGLVVILLMPLAFPEVESASFFSTSSIEEPPPIDYYKLYIPANPFEAMASGYVPAIVLFSISMRLALIGMEGDSKEQILVFMSTVTEVFSRITRGLIHVLPIGIFAMSAAAAGTMGVEEFANLQVYLVCMVILTSLLAFWVLPWVIAALTPVGYREALRISRAGVVTAFATGNVFIVLPVIIEECKTIMREKNALDDDGDIMIDILVPIAYSFPNVGKLTVMFFVMFAGWFTGHPVPVAEYLSFAVGGVLSLFGSVYVAIPFMLDLVHLPADVFQLFVMSGFITGKFSSMVSIVNLFALTLISVAIFQGVLKRGLQHWVRLGVGVAAGVVIVVGATRLGLENFVDAAAATDEVIANMKVAEEVPMKVSRNFPIDGETKERRLADVQTIKQRGVLRVGYRPSNVPFSYHNNAADLVGFDVEMATLLARDLDVSVEFVPFKKDALADGLDRGYFDLAVSGLAMNIDDMQRVIYSTPVMELNRSVVVLDYRVKEFDTQEKLRTHEPFTLAYVEHDDAISRVKPEYPNVTFTEIDDYKTFFKQKPGTYDSLLISAQAGSAWTLFFPNYGVTSINRTTSYPVAYAIAQDNPQLLRFVDNWLKLQKIGGEQQRMYDYWILGRGAKEVGERWSVIRDVLGWVD
ncbi:MAG: cation:dicarboxylase symporter family transporter, partial [Deltaproteobacteria bacterium]|nr:cation:dicarboxylase symporter family transporter [Deltaproteobacteria bacterium]